MIEHILVPVDFSDTSEKIIATAIEQANAFNASIHLIHVQAPFVNDALHNVKSSITFDDASSELQKFDQQHLDKVADEIKGKSIPCSTLLANGNPAEEILTYCDENAIDLIIIGSHGHGALHHIILGSVSEKVLHKAPCPVLVVRS